MASVGKKLNVDKIVSRKKLPSVVYGLKGIMQIFDVSKSKAFSLRHGIIESACSQNGNVIIVDVRKALRLFGMEDVDNIVVDE